MPRFMKFDKGWTLSQLENKDGVFKLRSVLVRLGGTKLYQQVLKEIKQCEQNGEPLDRGMGIITDDRGSYFADLQKLLKWLKRVEAQKKQEEIRVLPKGMTRQRLLSDPPRGVFELSKVLKILTYAGHPLVYSNFRRRILTSDDARSEYAAYWLGEIGYVAELPRFIEKFIELEPGSGNTG